MKKASLLLCLFASLAPLRADSPSVWTTLDAQALQMAQAVRDRDTHALHQLDHAINDEVGGLKASVTDTALAAALDDIGREAAAAHHDAHAADWDKAAADQAALGKALQAAEARVTGKK